MDRSNRHRTTLDVWLTFYRVSASTNSTYQSDLQSRMDPGMFMHSTVNGTIEGSHPVYETNFIYFMAAAVVEVIVVAVLIPIYWGWWTLGRPVSFSPLEIAKVEYSHT
jgi:hypothetical protein